jgi:hypothetical protein
MRAVSTIRQMVAHTAPNLDASAFVKDTLSIMET